ncbi:hypothetical protein CPT_Stills82 [Bacillus phage Stills]|uniref:Uncharacterized protein n=1 Tax=Bacillus phage Stills TaxID=1610833 RepID=A0A0E3T7Q2_9CAUD|nr:hypothetical protein CPT_Stills82 [Bacillus phage Stills]AKC02710.1 hypothetical protein CPT_Stills82 [Bacillus phage Stills]
MELNEKELLLVITAMNQMLMDANVIGSPTTKQCEYFENAVRKHFNIEACDFPIDDFDMEIKKVYDKLLKEVGVE